MDILNSLGRISLLILFFLIMPNQSSIANNSTQKQKVIAAAIFKFIKFIDWENQNDQNTEYFNMCLQQHDAAFEPFESRTIKGKTIKLHILAAQNPLNCHVVYFNTTEQNTLKTLANLKQTATLTISEQTNFIKQGGIIELNNHNNRLAFSINLPASKQQHLHISFQLLSLARYVIES